MRAAFTRILMSDAARVALYTFWIDEAGVPSDLDEDEREFADLRESSPRPGLRSRLSSRRSGQPMSR